MKIEKNFHLIQKLLEADSCPEVSDPCEVCGEDAIHLVEDHTFHDDKYGLKLSIPAYVCSSCGEESYPDTSYQHILQQVEIAKGKPYMKIEIRENGDIIRYAVH